MQLILAEELTAAVRRKYGNRLPQRLLALPQQLPWSREVVGEVRLTSQWPAWDQTLILPGKGRSWPQERLVWLNLERPTSKDLLAAAVHELRHIWQYYVQRDFMQREVQTDDPIIAYWMKPCEVDARRAEWCYRYRLPQPVTVGTDWPIGRTEFTGDELSDPLTGWWLSHCLFANEK